ncbi:MAG: PepSY domain-containing protein [Rhodothalassiaceae bacterium]
MVLKRLSAGVAAIALATAVSLPAAAEDWADEDQAAREMMAGVFVYDVGDFMLPSEVAANLLERGYTEIEDFDIEYNRYEVEVEMASGEELELEIDPVTGAILDVDDNWF